MRWDRLPVGNALALHPEKRWIQVRKHLRILEPGDLLPRNMLVSVDNSGWGGDTGIRIENALV